MRIALSGLWPPTIVRPSTVTVIGCRKCYSKQFIGIEINTKSGKSFNRPFRNKALKKKERLLAVYIFAHFHSFTFSHIFALGNYLLVIPES